MHTHTHVRVYCREKLYKELGLKITLIIVCQKLTSPLNVCPEFKTSLGPIVGHICSHCSVNNKGFHFLSA